MTQKMQAILENLRHAIGEETVATMTAPFAVPLGQPNIQRTFPGENGVEGVKLVGDPTEQPGGDPKNYDKEQEKSD